MNWKKRRVSMLDSGTHLQKPKPMNDHNEGATMMSDMLGEATDSPPIGTPCLILRTTCRSGCVVQIQETGTVIEIELVSPLEISRACLICATQPVPATIQLGQLKGNVIRDCNILQVDWPKHQGFAPPARFQRRKRQSTAAACSPEDASTMQHHSIQ